ncbi:MAG: pilin [Candidatus Nomurabacteria bacterium]|nr:pilin [Candidatus Nomurabacteria bacterium]
MKNKLIVLSGFVLGLSPVVALAQVGTVGATSNNCDIGVNGTLLGVLCKIGQILNAVVPVLIALGIVYFVWGVISYVIGTDEETKKSAREKMVYGIIGLAVIVAVWGLVRILTNTFQVNNTGQVTLPTIPIVQ